MTAYCDRCGEDPIGELDACIECGENLCEACHGMDHGTFAAVCRRCKNQKRRQHGDGLCGRTDCSEPKATPPGAIHPKTPFEIAQEALHEAEALVLAHEQDWDEQVWVSHRRRFEQLNDLVTEAIEAEPEPPAWIPAPPSKPGLYWFYGRINPEAPDRLYAVEARLQWDGGLLFFHIASSTPMREQAFSGQWQPAILPQLPEVKP